MMIKYFNSIKRYSSLVFWLLREGLKGQVYRTVTILSLSFIGVGTVAVSFALLLGYARHRINGRVFQYKGHVINVPDDMTGLFLVAVVALFFGVLSALCTFWAQRKVLQLSSVFHRRAIVKTISVLEASYMRPELDRIKFLAPKHDQRHIATIYTNYLAMSLKMLLESIQPLLMLFVSVVVLFYLDIFATLALLPLIVFYLSAIYVVGTRSTSLQGDYLTQISSANPILFDFYNHLFQSDNPSLDQKTIEKVLDEQKIDSILSPFYGRLLASYQSSVVSQLFLSISMVWLFVVFGFSLGEGKGSWTSMLAYLISLRFSGQSIKRCATLLVGVCRFYPAIRIYKEFIFDTEKKINQNCSSNRKLVYDEKIILENKELDASITQRKSLQIVKGEPSFILSFDADGNHFLKGRVKMNLDIALCFSDLFSRESVYFHGTPKIVATLTIKDWALGSCCSKKDESALLDFFNELGVLREVEMFPHGLNEKCTNKLVENMSHELAYTVTSAYLFIKKRSLVIIDLRGFYPLDQFFQNKFLEMLSDCFVFFFSGDISTLDMSTGRFDLSEKSPVIIVSNDKILGFCDIQYMKEKQNELEALKLAEGKKEQDSSSCDTLEFDDEALF